MQSMIKIHITSQICLFFRFVEELPWNESMMKMPFDNYPFVWKNYSRAGYRTLYAEDAPKIAIFVYEKEVCRK